MEQTQTNTKDISDWAAAEERVASHLRWMGTIPGATPSAETDPLGRDPHAPGAKLDAGKPLPWLMLSGFSNALREVTDVTTKGARKYTPNGWQDVPQGSERYMEAFARHMIALGTGEVVDPDTGCKHKAQMIWNLLASLELDLRAVNGWRPNV